MSRAGEICPALYGNTNATRKLTEGDVRLIRQLHQDKQEQIKRLNASCSVIALAEKFEVSHRTIERVLNYETWRHVDA